MRLLCLPWLAVLSTVSLSGSARAGLEEVEKGVFVDDFEKGGVDGLSVDEAIAKRKDPKLVPQVMKIQNDGDGKALFLKGAFQNSLYYCGKTFKDFSLEAEIKKGRGSYGGVVVRDRWRVYFQMRGFLCLNAQSGTEGVPDGELWKSAETFTGYHKLKVVCVGPLLHVYVDGRSMVRYRIAEGAGRVGFYSHGGGEVSCRSFRIETQVDPLEALQVEPQAPKDALVFTPDEAVKLDFAVHNYLDQEQTVEIAASVNTWAGETLKAGGRQAVKVGAAGSALATFDLGRLAAGFFRIDLQADCQGKPICRKDDIPLAIQRPWTGTFQAPLIPLAPYSKYMCEKSPLYMYTYAHAMANSLREHNLNAVVADPMLFTTPKVYDIFRSYGIAVITRSAGYIDHPAVIGALVEDEPKMEEMETLKAKYESLRQQTDKPFTTCMVGEATGLGDTVQKWEILRSTKPGLRCLRWYGVKKSYYDALHDLKYKGNLLPLPDLLRVVEASEETPYWFVIPSFGGTDHEAYYQDPSPPQLTCMMHLAMAYGARGLLFYTLHRERDRWAALVEQKSLQPCDRKYEALASVAARIQAQASLLVSLRHGPLDMRCSDPCVEVVPREAPDTGRLYAYVVNKNAKAPASIRLWVPARAWELAKVEDVFAGKRLDVTRDEAGFLGTSLALEPGEGTLLATDAKALH